MKTPSGPDGFKPAVYPHLQNGGGNGRRRNPFRALPDRYARPCPRFTGGARYSPLGSYRKYSPTPSRAYNARQ